MNQPTNCRTITISSVDHKRLQELLLVVKQFASPMPECIRHLNEELQRANIVPPEQIPPYVVSMNTQVKLVDVHTGKSSLYTLVFPADADLDEGKLSILSDLGIAILGACVGDTVECDSPEGRRPIRIELIAFQPEAAKQYGM